MKRDMELIRKILFAIEEQYVDVALYDLEIEGYDQKTIAYHCRILHDANFISDYNAEFAGDELCSFGIGSLTWEGHEFLDKIRSDTVWNKTKTTMKEQGLPFALDVIKNVASAVISGMTQAAIKGM
jgi:hypothetical protein